jgi:hypothetical protein
VVQVLAQVVPAPAALPRAGLTTAHTMTAVTVDRRHTIVVRADTIEGQVIEAQVIEAQATEAQVTEDRVPMIGLPS